MSEKRSCGDRKDGKLIRNLDSLHYITGIIYPNRCDNEAFISETVDLTAINEYLAKKNAENPEYKYNLFQVFVTVMLKMITLRPKMNRFIVNGNFYQKNEITTSFVVKKLFADDGAEALAIVKGDPEDNLDSIHEKIYRIVSKRKSKDDVDSTTGAMNIFNKIPRWFSKAMIHIIMWLDKHGWVPSSMIEEDPYYTSCVISNLGSIKMKSGYHHLTNWGTCGMIALLGEIKEKPIILEDGSVEKRTVVDVGITIDERLADGYYYSKSIRLFRKLMENPQLLELPLSQEVEY